jgi:glutaminyl-tRNA synthetase
VYHHAKTAEVRLYDRLFKSENPAAEESDFKNGLNSDSLQIITAYVENDLASAVVGKVYQFIRKGYLR